MGAVYKNLIFTNHALARMRQRGLSKGDVWATWRHPDKSRYAKSQDGWIYNRKYKNQKIEVVAKKNEKGEWLVISAWSKPVFTNHKTTYKLSYRLLWQPVITATLYILYLIFVARFLAQNTCLNIFGNKIFEFNYCKLSTISSSFLGSGFVGFVVIAAFYYYLTRKIFRLILVSLLLIILLITAYYLFLNLAVPRITTASVYLDSVK